MGKPNGDVKRILVVEDEPAIGALYRRVLIGEGFEVDIAVNGKLAQDMTKDKQYALCLLDIRIPEMNGIEFYQWLREKCPQLVDRVIFSTGSMIGEDTSAFIEQTGRPFLPKPFTPEELKAIVWQTLKEVER